MLTKDDRRQTILTTTLEMIAEGGVDSVTHRRIAKRASIPLGSTTYYFESREHLIRATFDFYLEQHQAIADDLPIDPSASKNDLVEFLIGFTTRERERPELMRAEYELTLFATRDEQLAATLHEWYDLMTTRIAGALKVLGASDAIEAAQSVLHMLRGYQLEQLTRPLSSQALRKRLHALVSAYL